MKLYILRHGMTGDSETDTSRQLTSNGRQEVVKIVRKKLDELSGITQIYSSPMLRVTTTLEIAANLMKFEGEIVVDQNLTTGCRLPELTEFLDGIDPTAGDILISSHQSCTSIIVLVLTGEDIFIPNGSLICIEADELKQGRGKILWQESASGDQIKRNDQYTDVI